MHLLLSTIVSDNFEGDETQKQVGGILVAKIIAKERQSRLAEESPQKALEPVSRPEKLRPIIASSPPREPVDVLYFRKDIQAVAEIFPWLQCHRA